MMKVNLLIVVIYFSTNHGKHTTVVHVIEMANIVQFIEALLPK